MAVSPAPGRHAARLDENLAAAREAARRLEAEVREGHQRAERASENLITANRQFDDLTRDGITPYVEMISHASAELARIEQELASLDRIQEAHSRLCQDLDDIAEMEKEQSERRQRLVVDGTKVRPLKDVVGHLNGSFRKIIRGINLPNSTGGARLDPATLLPLVDEQEFQRRGGGARAAVSIAYSLTLLTYAREQADAKLPAFLMVDSPQKNLGSNKHDTALSRRVYERFIDYMSEVSADERFRRPFQLIIVDNDIPPDIARRMKVVSFDHGNGFIRDLKTLQASDNVQLSIDDLDDQE